MWDMATAPPEEAGDPAANCNAPENKMIARTWHQDAAGEDPPKRTHEQSKVWQTMSEVCRDNNRWTCIKPFQRSRDGPCGAFQALHMRFLGANHVNNVAGAAEAKQSLAKHHGEKKRCNFELHVSTLKEQFQVPSNPPKRQGCAGIDESSKVWRLNAGINAKKLNAPKAQIMPPRALQGNFDDAVSRCQDFITKSKPNNKNDGFNVSGCKEEAALVEEDVAETDTKEEAAEEEADDAVEEAEAEEEIANESTSVMVMSRICITPLKSMPSWTPTRTPSSSIFVSLARTNKMQGQLPKCPRRQLSSRSKCLKPKPSSRAETRMTKMGVWKRWWNKSCSKTFDNGRSMSERCTWAEIDSISKFMGRRARQGAGGGLSLF
jgi:hypothetical protein